MPKTYNYLGHPMRFHRRLILDPALLKSRYNLTYDLLTHHTRFNYKEIKAVMPVDTVYVTIVREPVHLFESLYVYYDLGLNLAGTNLTLEEFLRVVANSSEVAPTESGPPQTSTKLPSWSLKNMFNSLLSPTKAKIDPNKRSRGKYGRNQMAFDLGKFF